jgi:AbiV family abortive infection protein
MPKLIKPYTGVLKAQQVADGMNAAFTNATRLLADAKILFEQERFASACSLAILSIEESGKISILRQLAVATNETELKSAWRQYRSHGAKNVQWIVTQLIREGARKLDDFSAVFDENSDHPIVLDTLKQLGFYSDCYGSAVHWSVPAEAIEKSVVEWALLIARVVLPKRAIHLREVELWIECMKPHLHTRNARQALSEYFIRLQSEGLSDHQSEDIEAFIGIAPVKH